MAGWLGGLDTRFEVFRGQPLLDRLAVDLTHPCCSSDKHRVKTASSLAFALVLASAPIQARSDESRFSRDRFWLNAGFYSLHFDRSREANLRDANPGVGLEMRLAPAWSLTAGRFTNSNDRVSRYVGVYYQPLEVLGGRAGVVAGGFDGYPKAFDGGWFPALIPVIGWERDRFGINVAMVPSYKDRLHGALSFQLKVNLR